MKLSKQILDSIKCLVECGRSARDACAVLGSLPGESLLDAARRVKNERDTAVKALRHAHKPFLSAVDLAISNADDRRPDPYPESNTRDRWRGVAEALVAWGGDPGLEPKIVNETDVTTLKDRCVDMIIDSEAAARADAARDVAASMGINVDPDASEDAVIAAVTRQQEPDQ